MKKLLYILVVLIVACS